MWLLKVATIAAAVSAGLRIGPAQQPQLEERQLNDATSFIAELPTAGGLNINNGAGCNDNLASSTSTTATNVDIDIDNNHVDDSTAAASSAASSAANDNGEDFNFSSTSTTASNDFEDKFISSASTTPATPAAIDNAADSIHNCFTASVLCSAANDVKYGDSNSNGFKHSTHCSAS
ncbi:LOW QUALITY PROTEIN: DUF3112 domain protein [Colletotrichum tofieldiae]|nr:LOW QUALITY PROTEIN: DUF3112 domain protein [Colletotrichum tofieldiae]GKT77179.1 LOW QUALITY PROTEIN: DUF3112 domain protein [Colletotrichum tofieldiae]GKT86434.1 LOW QUALITY PROTEIN: DUF3112 domain protein [Colletotrichum tofieldiae]